MLREKTKKNSRLDFRSDLSCDREKINISWKNVTEDVVFQQTKVKKIMHDFVLIPSPKMAAKSCKENTCRNKCKKRNQLLEKGGKKKSTQVKNEKKKAYTVTAWPPKVYRILVAPVKYSTSFVGAECDTPSTCKIKTSSKFKYPL